MQNEVWFSWWVHADVIEFVCVRLQQRHAVRHCLHQSSDYKTLVITYVIGLSPKIPLSQLRRKIHDLHEHGNCLYRFLPLVYYYIITYMKSWNFKILTFKWPKIAPFYTLMLNIFRSIPPDRCNVQNFAGDFYCFWRKIPESVPHYLFICWLSSTWEAARSEIF